MTEQHYGPTQLIMKEGQMDDHAIYLIIDGNVEFFHKLEDRV